MEKQGTWLTLSTIEVMFVSEVVSEFDQLSWREIITCIYIAFCEALL